MMTEVDSTLPPHPYMGLMYFRAAERALFSGRNDEIDACKALLTTIETRVLILHGITGCGKSSFLRAGLIPALELESNYHFVRNTQGVPVLIRAGSDPIARVAEAIYDYAQPAVEIDSAIGPHSYDLTAARLGAPGVVDFVAMCRSPLVLIKSLRVLYKILPFVLVLIIDQAEEVITFAGPRRERLKEFINFIKDFSVCNFPVKCIISLRKDYSGEFIGLAQMRSSIDLREHDPQRMLTEVKKEPAVQQRVPDDARQVSRQRSDIKIFLLPELARDAVLHAITLPTSDSPVPNGGVPRRRYKFVWEKEGAEELCTDLFSATSSVLPVMQIVCRDLYNRVHPTPPGPDSPVVEISKTLYVDAGRITGPVEGHITTALQASFGRGLSGRERTREVEQGRQLLGSLVSRRRDGSVFSNQVTIGELRERARKLEIRSDLDEVVRNLSRDDVLLLRTYAQKSALDEGAGQLVSLGHDFLALILYEWQQRRLAENAAWMRIVRGAASAFGAVIISAFLIWLINHLATIQRGVGERAGIAKTAAKVMIANAGKQAHVAPYTSAMLYGHAIDIAEQLAEDHSAPADSRFDATVVRARLRLSGLLAGLPAAADDVVGMKRGTTGTSSKTLDKHFVPLRKSNGVIEFGPEKTRVYRATASPTQPVEFDFPAPQAANIEFGEAVDGSISVVVHDAQGQRVFILDSSSGKVLGPFELHSFAALAAQDSTTSSFLTVSNETVLLYSSSASGRRHITVFVLDTEVKKNGIFNKMPFKMVAREISSSYISYNDDHLITLDGAKSETPYTAAGILRNDTILRSYDLHNGFNEKNSFRIALADNIGVRDCRLTGVEKLPCLWGQLSSYYGDPRNTVLGFGATRIGSAPADVNSGLQSTELTNYEHLLFINVADGRMLYVDQRRLLDQCDLASGRETSDLQAAKVFYFGDIDNLTLGYVFGAEVELVHLKNELGRGQPECEGALYLPDRAIGWSTGDADGRLLAVTPSSIIVWNNTNTVLDRESSFFQTQRQSARGFASQICATPVTVGELDPQTLGTMTGLELDIPKLCPSATAAPPGPGRHFEN
ncbi:MAG: hypothetical protein JWO52_6945 [Gammaproteobacteria bacterium]|jgi:hypothetical protein|nr:hypothetical protein [Gammaproteobacteria bacterium]